MLMGIFDGLLRRTMTVGSDATAGEVSLGGEWAPCSECGELDLPSDMRDDLCENCAEVSACDECGAETLTSHLDDGLCANCFENQGNFAPAGHGSVRYCCGAIYEEGETECRSCGETL